MIQMKLLLIERQLQKRWFVLISLKRVPKSHLHIAVCVKTLLGIQIRTYKIFIFTEITLIKYQWIHQTAIRIKFAYKPCVIVIDKQMACGELFYEFMSLV